MKNWLYPAPLLILLLLIIGSCRTYRAPEFRYVENLTVENIGLNHSTLGMDLRYNNPNRGRVKIKKAEGDAWLDNNYLGHFTLDTLVEVPSESEFVLPVKLELDMEQIIRNSLILAGNKEVPIRIEGTAKLGKSGVYMNYPIRYSGTQKLRKLIR